MFASNGSLTPAALVPFCAYQTNMTLLGKKTQGLDFTACSHFQPTLLKGQLCYSLNHSSIEAQTTKSGKRGGLVLLLDLDGHRNDLTLKESTYLEDMLDLEVSEKFDRSAKIYLNTLSSFTAYKSGSYGMTALKKITGTESFLKQTDEDKKCRIETKEECEAKSFIEAVEQKCGCVPWAISSALSSKV